MATFDALVTEHYDNCTEAACVWCGPDLLAAYDADAPSVTSKDAQREAELIS
jgi:hypothetical protein